MRENHVVPLDGSWHGPCVGMPQRSVASAIASVGVPHSAWEVAMLAPLGRTGVGAPVPSTGPDFSGLPRGRGAHYEGDAPSDPSFATLPHPPARRCGAQHALCAPPYPTLRDRGELPCVREWDARTCRIWRR